MSLAITKKVEREMPAAGFAPEAENGDRWIKMHQRQSSSVGNSARSVGTAVHAVAGGEAIDKASIREGSSGSTPVDGPAGGRFGGSSGGVGDARDRAGDASPEVSRDTARDASLDMARDAADRLFENPLDGIYSQRMRERIEREGAGSASEVARDTEISRRADDLGFGFDISREAQMARITALNGDIPAWEKGNPEFDPALIRAASSLPRDMSREASPDVSRYAAPNTSRETSPEVSRDTSGRDFFSRW